MKKTKDHSIIQSLDKGLYLLEVIEQANAPVTLNSLWKKVQWDKATIHRLLATLEKRGYINRDPKTKSYTLGIKIYGLYNSLINELDLQGITHPYLNQLVQETGESAHLAVALEKNIVFIDRVVGSDVISVNTQIGSREPIHCTALGKAYIAYYAEEEIIDLVDAELPKYTAKTITNIDVLKEELEKIYERGYAIDNEEYSEGVRCIGAAVLNQFKMPIAMIGVSGPKYRISMNDAHKYGKLIGTYALEISQRFGYVPDNEQASAEGS